MTTTARARSDRQQVPAAHDGGTPHAPDSFTVATLFGALAIIGGATALTPLISGTSWLLQITEIVAVMWLVGVGARLVGTPDGAVTLLQFLTFLLSVTGLQLHSGIGGFVPGPAAIDEATTAVRAAWDQIMTTLPPTPATADITLFATIAVGLLALVSDQLIAGAKAPALVGLPLLALYSVPAAVAPDMLPWFAFVLPAACFAGVLATAPPRTGRPTLRAAVSLIITSSVIAVSAIGTAVALSDTAVGIGTDGRLPHSGQPAGQIGLSPWARLRGELSNSNPVDVARVDGLATPTYLRTFALEKWAPGTGFGLGAVVADTHDVNGALPPSASATDASNPETVTVTPQQYRDKYLPMYLNTSSVDGIGSGWNFDSALGTIFRTSAATPPPYSVTVNTMTATEAELRDVTITGRQDLTNTDDVPDQVVELAKQVAASATNDFDKVNALLNFFTDPANGFSYSLKTPLGNSGNALVDFLSSRTGYCEQYAAAMAIMVRSLGIPARVGIGFTQGEKQSDGSYDITSTDAHAWVEVPFDKFGWIIFDPTPAVDGQGGLQGFAAGAAADHTPGTTSTAPTGTAATGSSALATTIAPRSQQSTVTTTTAVAGSTNVGSVDWLLIGRWISIIVALGAVIAAAAAAPSLIRHRRRQRRLAVAATSDPAAATAAWQEIVDTAVDHGVEIGIGDSVRTIANNIARHADLSAHARTNLRSVVTSVETDWYGNGSAELTPPGGSGSAGPATAVRAVISGLQHSRPQPWRSRWWPPSLRSK